MQSQRKLLGLLALCMLGLVPSGMDVLTADSSSIDPERVEHCAGANYVDGLEPSQSQIWPVGSTGILSWLVGTGCGPLSYGVELSRNSAPYESIGITGPHEFDGRLEFPWVVSGAIGDQLSFRVHRVVPDRVLPDAYTAPIEIGAAVPIQRLSWSMLRAKY